MSLNIVNDAWIPVLSRDGKSRLIRPDQIVEPDIASVNWPRADLNIACIELLIGLTYLADPPSGPEDWEERRPDHERLRGRMADLAPAFNLDGDGPRFLQDLEPLPGKPTSPDLLFIDSAGEKTADDNADLMVRRSRYPSLEPSLAAIALYALQAHAPSGGAGNRTSMRGGGPLITLVDPHGSLWDLVWANVPDGNSQGPANLPWMRPTRTSEKDQQTLPPQQNAVPAQAFFGMPRRLRLVFDGGLVTGVIQRPHGTKYVGWRHPLTPYYQSKPGAELLPVLSRPGLFGYHNWLGVVAAAPGDDLHHLAGTVTTYNERVPARKSVGPHASVIVAGWATSNMKPLDYVLSRQPLVLLDADSALFLRGMIEAADKLGWALRRALHATGIGKSKLDGLREEFFLRTQSAFEAHFARLDAGADSGEIAPAWLTDMRRAAFAIFDAEAMSGLDQFRIDQTRKIIIARSKLRDAFNGYASGRAAFAALGLEPIIKETAQ